MTEKQLIQKIKQLRQIKPRENWVFLTKEKIFEENYSKDKVKISLIDELSTGLKFVWGRKFAFAPLILLIVFLGAFGFVQNSLPGDVLYSVKKIVEKSQATIFGMKESPQRSLELANKRLNDLTKIAKNNSVKNLAPAINEYKAKVSEAAKSLMEESREGDLKKVREITLEIKKLEENKQKVEALGVVIDGTEELNNALAQIIEREIDELEQREPLTDNQQEFLDKIKEDYNNGDYSQALEKILYFGNNE